MSRQASDTPNDAVLNASGGYMGEGKGEGRERDCKHPIDLNEMVYGNEKGRGQNGEITRTLAGQRKRERQSQLAARSMTWKRT
jgi:hypothetical protein